MGMTLFLHVDSLSFHLVQISPVRSFTSQIMDLWGYHNQVQIDFSRPGKTDRQRARGLVQWHATSRVFGCVLVRDSDRGQASYWYIAGTLCGGKVQGAFATKLANCRDCGFYQLASQEEGRDLAKSSDVLARLK
jgi:hypothetical protein